MKPDELFEILNDIDDKFIDDVIPKEEIYYSVEPRKMCVNKWRFPWVIAAAAACLAVCAAVGTVIVMNAGKNKIPVAPDDPMQSGLNTVATEEIYAYDSADSVQPTTFIMNEFGEDVKFTVDDTLVMRTDKNGNVTPLIGFPRIYKVCLGDLNGDGKREIIAEGWNGLSGLSANYIQAYDLESSKLYRFTNWGDCFIEIEDGVVYAVKRNYDQNSDSEVYSRYLLSLDIMELWNADSPDVDEIYNIDSQTKLPLTFTIEELETLPYFKISNDKTVKRLSGFDMNIAADWEIFSDNVYVRSVYLCDLDGDGYREIAAAVTDENGEKSVRVADVRNQKEYEYKPQGYESGLQYDSLTLKDGKLYLCVEDGSSVSREPLILDIMNEVSGNVTEPDTPDTPDIPAAVEDPNSSADSDPLNEFSENDNVRLSVNIPKSAYQKGEIIPVTAEVYNKSDKTVYLFGSPADSKTHSEIRTVISLDGRKLNDIDSVPDFNDVEYFVGIKPGETYTLEMRFDTTYTGDEFLGISRQPVQAGVYQGICAITVTESSNYDSPRENCALWFQIEIQ